MEFGWMLRLPQGKVGRGVGRKFFLGSNKRPLPTNCSFEAANVQEVSFFKQDVFKCRVVALGL